MLYDIENGITDPIDFVKIGKIGKAYGILGWVKVISFTYKPDDIFNYMPWCIDFQCVWRLIYLDTWKISGKHYIAKIKNISNRESAQLLLHCFIFIKKNQFPQLQNGEYYCRDLIGCAVITDYEEHLGYVVRIIETTVNDVLVVKLCKKGSVCCLKQEHLIPFIQNKVIKEVNIHDRIIIVAWDINF